MIAVFATMVARQGCRDRLLDELRRLGAAVADEPGTLVYAMHTSYQEPEVVRFYELYAGRDALRAHAGSTAMARFTAATADLLAAPTDIIRCDLVESKGLPPERV